MIYFVTSRKEDYTFLDFEEYDDLEMTDDILAFVSWQYDEPRIQLDTETNIVEDGPMQHELRKLYVLQLGSMDKEVQYVIDMIDLSDDWVEAIKACLSNEDTSFICHNAKFEYLVIRSNLGVTIEDVHDTYLMSRIINTGLDLMPGYHGLAGCLRRFFNVEMDKEQQTGFTGAPLTADQIGYAALDVMFLEDLFIKLKELLENWNLYKLYNEVERQVLKAYCDMELTPMRIDMKYWNILTQSFIVEAKSIKAELNDILMEDLKLVKYLKNSLRVLKKNLVQPNDEYKINWASTIFKRDALGVLAPSLPVEVKTKPQIKKFLKEQGDKIPLDQKTVLTLYMARSYEKLNEVLINNHDEFLRSKDYFVPENTVLVNWASPVDRLYVFQFYYSKLEDTNSKSLIRIKKNKLITRFKDWTKANKNVTSYGERFANKYVKDGDMIAPFKLNQILATGRISFGILLQMPAKTDKFRNAFFPPNKGDVFVDTDYSSMEVLIAAYAAGEIAFITAIKQGKDLHSMSASLLFKDKWKKLAEPGCEHLKTGKRCKCIGHSKFRDFSKTVTFGLFYGISSHGLSERLDISKEEAQDIINRFFKAFPNFERMFKKNREFAIENNYIRGLAPMKRIRFFLHPDNPGETSSIGRAAMNFPIQEHNSTILKVALIKLRKKIIEFDLPYKIHLPIHDEILSSCSKELAKDLKLLQEEVMLEAAAEMLEPNLCTVDSKITFKWEK